MRHVPLALLRSCLCKSIIRLLEPFSELLAFLNLCFYGLSSFLCCLLQHFDAKAKVCNQLFGNMSEDKNGIREMFRISFQHAAAAVLIKKTDTSWKKWVHVGSPPRLLLLQHHHHQTYFFRYWEAEEEEGWTNFLYQNDVFVLLSSPLNRHRQNILTLSTVWCLEGCSPQLEGYKMLQSGRHTVHKKI